MKNKSGQVTIFIIIAIVIVVGIVAYFLLAKPSVQGVPGNFKPVYDQYLSCLKEQTQQGVSLLGEQAGWIEPPEFVPGSQYMPFSSQMDFLGQPVPYWLYVAGNNILKEQVPSREDMEMQLEGYISERVSYCNFDNFPNFEVEIGSEPGVVSEIEDNSVDVRISNSVKITSEDGSIFVDTQTFSVSSNLGKYHSLALKIYNHEKQYTFLEKYALDVMRLYAPVTGVELTCSPKVFNEQKIREDIVNALTENVAAIKIKGDYYSLSTPENRYFETDIGSSVNENVNFIYTPQMTTRIEIYGDKVVEPVGLQEGLGMLGFCYVPYHLIYDINFPVLIQIYDNKEIFQFPIAVIINKNKERNALEGEAGQSIESEICKYSNYPVEVHTYDASLNPVPARIKMKCLNEECSIGSTKMQGGSDAAFVGNFPACVNGFIIASAEGYADSKYQISTNEEDAANIIMNKLYNVSLDLGKVDSAIIYFRSPEYSTSVLYPDSPYVQLIEGNYNITVYAYRNSTIMLEGISEKKCTQVPSSGIGGIFGMTEEKCVDINLPAQEVNFAINGGGNGEEYFTEGQLKDAKKLNINVPLFKTPANVMEVQDNYLALDDSRILLEIIR